MIWLFSPSRAAPIAKKLFFSKTVGASPGAHCKDSINTALHDVRLDRSLLLPGSQPLRPTRARFHLDCFTQELDICAWDFRQPADRGEVNLRLCFPSRRHSVSLLDKTHAAHRTSVDIPRVQMGNREIASAVFKCRSVTGDDWQAILCPVVEIE